MLLSMRKRFAGRDDARTAGKAYRPGLLLKELLASTVLVGLLAAAPASALNSIVLNPDFLTVTAGEQFQLDLIMNFDDATIGGGVEIYYDSLVSFVSFAWDTAFLSIANFGLAAPVPGQTGQPLEVGFGFFNPFNPTSGVSGSHVVGTFTFDAIAQGPTQFITTSASPLSPGPFYSPINAMTPMVVEFGQSEISIVPDSPVVPEPTSAILMFLGLAGLSIYPSARVKNPSVN